MLGGNDHGVHGDRRPVLIGDGDLGLPVGIEPGQGTVLAHPRQLQGHPVAQGDGQGHLLGRLVAGVAEHHALVPGAEFRVGGAARFQRVVHAHGDIRALVVDRGHDGAGIAVEEFLRAVVADLRHGLADDGVDIHIGIRRDFAHDGDDPGGRDGFAGDARDGIQREDRVEHRVRNLVAELVGMAFGDGFGSKESAHIT